MDDYHQSLQVYAHHACPDPEKYQKRHTTLLTKDITEAEIFKTKTDTFAVLDGYAYRQTKKTNLDPGDEQEYIMRSMEYLKENQNGGTSRCFEPCGIKHPIQAWIQQGNPNKVCVIFFIRAVLMSILGAVCRRRHYQKRGYPGGLHVLHPKHPAGLSNHCFVL